ncbi:hypothetical protein [Tenggerimyces flavus]|uniref:Uncharacterized protein n=1 Tax=Tenggerimyces flavus TaxID=1708749 RepID=A0ABV7Y2E2_9ACTN|nr:hypothetical protein [Tenggerimyces flavus]MBM7790738.1 hypothetical protein [Tenggerimyces flavus]
MATSENRFLRYLGSTKNLVGSAAGLAGLGLTFTGIAGPYWPLVVAALYAAGALLAPPEKPKLVLSGTAEDVGPLRTDLASLGTFVDRSSSRLPAGAVDTFRRISAKLSDVLGHPNAGSDPEVLHVLSLTIRRNLPESLQAFLSLPRWYTPRSGERSPGDELLYQLSLQERYVTDTAEQIYRADTQGIKDFTIYLENLDKRRHASGELDLGDSS